MHILQLRKFWNFQIFLTEPNSFCRKSVYLSWSKKSHQDLMRRPQNNDVTQSLFESDWEISYVWYWRKHRPYKTFDSSCGSKQKRAAESTQAEKTRRAVQLIFRPSRQKSPSVLQNVVFTIILAIRQIYYLFFGMTTALHKWRSSQFTIPSIT